MAVAADVANSVSPDKENEPAVCVAAPTSSMHVKDSKPSFSSSRPSTVDERDAGAAAAVCLAVGGSAVRRPSSSSKPPPPPPPARAPHSAAAAAHASSGGGGSNSRCNSRSEGQPAVAPKPPPSPFLPAASSGSSVRGKGWVAGVSDSLGLSLSGGCPPALRCTLVASARHVM